MSYYFKTHCIFELCISNIIKKNDYFFHPLASLFYLFLLFLFFGMKLPRFHLEQTKKVLTRELVRFPHKCK